MTVLSWVKFTYEAIVIGKMMRKLLMSKFCSCYANAGNKL